MECRDISVMGGVGEFVTGTAEYENVIATDDHRGIVTCAVVGRGGGDESRECPIEEVWRIGECEAASVMVDAIHL